METLSEKRRKIAERLMTPEPCLAGPCRSPTACQGWGYCRDRNLADNGAPTPEEIVTRRKAAEERAGLAALEGEEGK